MDIRTGRIDVTKHYGKGNKVKIYVKRVSEI